MSDRVLFNRRDFLRLVGIGVAGTAAGCASKADRLIPYLVAPEDILPGVAYWYAGTCLECPAGCGTRVKAREGRAIKIEGDPAHPLSRGGLCARGQAGLQGLYDPDRVQSPMRRQGGAWQKIGWDEALQLAGQKIGEAARAKRGVAVVTGHATGSLQRLEAGVAAAAAGTYLMHEAFAHESLREANRRTFGTASVPRFDLGGASMVVSFGADFLETWISPVDHGRGFAALRANREATFVAVEPRLSLTGANADEWVAIRPGGEMALALGMAHVILTENLGPSVPERGELTEAVAPFTPEAVAGQTDVPAEAVTALARRFAARRPSLALAGGVSTQSEQSVPLIAAVNLLNYVAGNVGQTVRFDRALNFDAVAPFGELQRLVQTMSEGKLDVLIVRGANPAYATPAWAGFTAAMDQVPFKISLSGVLDETAEHCDLLLPTSHSLETLGDAEPVRGQHALIQPAMQRLPMFDARPAGDVWLALAKSSGLSGAWADDWTQHVKAHWRQLHQRFGAGRDFDAFWNESLKNGGVWEDAAAPAVRWVGAPAFAAPELKGSGDLALVLFPSIAMFDGRGANKSWLQELPDPTTKAVWGSWVEIHPDTAAKLGIRHGDSVKVESEAGSLVLPAALYAGMRPDIVAVPLGQGHSAYGRWARGIGANALALLSAAQDGASGAVAYLSAKVRVSKSAGAAALVTTQRERTQGGNNLARVIPISELMSGGHHEAAHGEGGLGEMPSQHKPGRYTEPRIKNEGEKTPAHAVTAFKPEEVVRAPLAVPIDKGSYKHAQHRWAMAIDLDSCTGCAACVVACYAENNIPVVGPEMVKRGREMSWIRIDRFEEKMAPGRPDVRFQPMLCQQCGDAPCEIVCPVYATYHNPEGLNAQVYNRCVGTRYCSNNCPYKVRAFNFFDYSAPEKATFAFPEPLNWQLNPDVTVRSKGVMEKCTFCVQRILEGKGIARDENRPLVDGEIQPACAQSCPTQAIVFGDLMDPESRVAKLSADARGYWALDEFNTKPGITYLKKIQRETA